MAKDNYFLDLHNKWGKSGKMDRVDGGGLCNIVHSDYLEFIETFEPSGAAVLGLIAEELSYVFWGSGLKADAPIEDLTTAYTPLRQTIILFCHEILNSK